MNDILCNFLFYEQNKDFLIKCFYISYCSLTKITERRRLNFLFKNVTKLNFKNVFYSHYYNMYTRARGKVNNSTCKQGANFGTLNYYLLFYNFILYCNLSSSLGSNLDILEDKIFKREDKYCQI